MASYEQRGKKKLWSVRFTITQNGKEVAKRLSGFERKKDAETAYRKFLENYKPSLYTSEAIQKDIYETKFGDIIPAFKEYKKPNVKESTMVDFESILDKHILPFFKDLKINEITKQKILEWQLSLQSYAYEYKSKIRTCLYSIYKYLYLYYDIDNVVARVEPFQKPKEKKEMQFWTLEEFNTFINCVDDLLWKTFFSFLYYTGCRLGEALALNINDIDLENKIITINKSITKKILEKNTIDTYKITSPKNYTSFRKILIPEKLLEILKTFIRTYPEIKRSRFLFFKDKPLADSTTYRRLEKFCVLSNIKRIRLHDFRHSHASLLISSGANIVLVAKRLGHSNTEQTLNTYAHLFPSTEHELLNKLNSIL